MTKFISLLFLVFIISSCATVDKKFYEINAGDTKDDVIAKLGYPENRQFKGSDEAFQYCTTGTSFGVSSYNVIWLYNGKVTGANSYNLHRGGLCSSHFESINWKDAPDKVIELRER